MYNEHYHAFGMHFFWWAIWIFLLIWIFFTPYEIPGQRSKKGTPLDILQKRYAAGQINKEEYLEAKKLIELC
jgi:putative membrane protein